MLFFPSVLWRQENAMQQQIASVREELSKKEQALRSITGKVGTRLLTWISNHLPGKVWHEITYPFPNFRYNHWSLGMDNQLNPTHCNGCDCFSMLGLKLIHVGKRVPWHLWGTRSEKCDVNTFCLILVLQGCGNKTTVSCVSSFAC